MYNEESASLVLRVGDLTANATTSVGTSDQYYTNMTWSNINLRTLLGAVYDKYDTFALVPVSFQSAVAGATIGATNDDRTVSINIAGLPFINNNYNSATKTNQNSAVIYTTRFIVSASIASTMGGTVLTFAKNQELVNLNIFYQRISVNAGSYNVTTTLAFPHMIFVFNIYGITKSNRVEDLNTSRLF
jgi:hypothetical protein